MSDQLTPRPFLAGCFVRLRPAAEFVIHERRSWYVPGLLVLLAGAWGGSPHVVHAEAPKGAPVPAGECEVSSVPEDLRAGLSLSPFYTQYISALDVPIIASDKVSPAALLEAKFLIEQMLVHRPELGPAIAKAKVRMAIMAVDEYTTDVPEHSDLRPAKYWNQRARGLGATTERPAVSCGEENLICCPGDPYAAENILIHEFGHVVHEKGMAALDPTFDDRLRAAFEAAHAEGLWQGAYAGTNRSEYWAEGVQSWFDTNREHDHDHNHVDTREELQEYDPRLAALCAEVFSLECWRYVRPAERTPAPAHFAGFDPEGKSFAWPEELQAYRRRFASGQEGLAPEGAVSLAPRAADDEAIAKSPGGGGGAAQLWMRNLTAEPLTIEWIDFDGRPRKYGALRPGDHAEQSTFAGHVWRLSGASGRVEHFVAEAPDCQIVIRDGAGDPSGDRSVESPGDSSTPPPADPPGAKQAP